MRSRGNIRGRGDLFFVSFFVFLVLWYVVSLSLALKIIVCYAKPKA